MTPTANNRGGSLSRTRREAGFLFGNEDSTSLLANRRNRRRLTESAASATRNREVRKEYIGRKYEQTSEADRN
jgi:hypothetical protein